MKKDVSIDFSKISIAEAYNLVDNYTESYNLFSIRKELKLSFRDFRNIIKNNLDNIK